MPTTEMVETAIGQLPSEWRVTGLGRICTDTATRQAINPGDFPDEEFDYYSIPAFQEHGAPIREIGGAILSQKLLVETGIVLFGKLNPRVPKIWMVTQDTPRRKIASTEFIPLRPNAELMSEHYLYFLAQSGYVLPKAKDLGSGSTPSRQRVDVRGFMEIPVPLPPLPEQRRIAAVLNAIQNAIAAQEDVIAAAKAFKRSLMQRLFTYGPGREPAPTKETEIGEIPAHWEITALGDVATIGNGSTPKRTNLEYWNNGSIPWLTSTKIHDLFIEQAEEYVTDIALKECHLPIVPKGSVLVAITGQGKTLGNAALTRIATTINQHLAYVTVRRQKLAPEFVLRYLNHRYRDLREAGQAGGSTKAALTCGMLKLYPIPFPPEPEQESTVECLAASDAKSAAEEDRKTALEALFKSMLHQLMTGQIRLLTDEGLPVGASDVASGGTTTDLERN